MRDVIDTRDGIARQRYAADDDIICAEAQRYAHRILRSRQRR